MNIVSRLIVFVVLRIRSLLTSSAYGDNGIIIRGLFRTDLNVPVLIKVIVGFENVWEGIEL